MLRERLETEMVPVGRLRPGMPLGRMVVAPTLTRPALGTPLTREDIDEIERSGPAVVPVLLGSDSAEYDGPAARARAELLHRVLTASLGTTCPEARALDPEHGARARHAIERALLAASSLAPLADLIADRWLNPRAMAAGSECALLAAVTGATLGWDEGRLADLALAALVADIGMSFLPPGLTLKPGRLGRHERRELRAHPALGAEALSPLAKIIPIVPRVALQHHERYDGRGYPARLRGDEIAPEAQVVAVIQRYLAAVADRPYRPSLPPHEASEVLMCSSAGLADPEIVEAFRAGVAIYPAGSLVRLSGGSGGRVLPGGMPTRPAIEILWDENGEPVAPHRIDLVDERVIFVTALSPSC